jgi:hypothetical protein
MTRYGIRPAALRASESSCESRYLPVGQAERQQQLTLGFACFGVAEAGFDAASDRFAEIKRAVDAVREEYAQARAGPIRGPAGG